MNIPLESPPPRESDAARAALEAMLDRVKRRGAWTWWTDGTLSILFFAYFIFACVFLVDRIRAGVRLEEPLLPAGWVLLALVGVTAGSAGWTAARAWWQGPREVELAFLTDRRFGLHERFSTALDLMRRLRDGEFTGRSAELARAQIEDAARFVRVQDPRQVFETKPLGHRWTSAVALLIALWIAFLPADDRRPFDPRRPVAPAAVAEKKNTQPPRPHRPPPKNEPRPEMAVRPVPRNQPTGGGQGKSEEPQPQPDPQQDPSGGGGGDGGKNGRPEGPQESPEQLFGEPERMKAKTRPKEADPLFGEGPMRKEDMTLFTGDSKGGEPGKSVPVDFPALFAEYKKVAERTLNGERIPTADRDFVRRYFDAIRPK